MKLICCIIIGVGIGVILWVSLVERFKHAELTETQLVLKYWKELLGGFLAIIGGYGAPDALRRILKK